MPLSNANIKSNTPMGVSLVPGGATFKVWAPLAQAVYLNGAFGGTANWTEATNPELLLNKDGAGYWTGFLANVTDGDQYKYYVVDQAGGGTSGYKRDPYARELTRAKRFLSK